MAIRRVSCVRSATLSIVLLTLLVGCGSSVDDFTGARGMVSGTVTFDGKPVPPGSTVMFQSKSGQTYVATGTVKEDGKYELVYQGKMELPAVSYLVQISPPLGGASTVESVPADPKDAKLFSPSDVKKKTEDAKSAKFPFPAKYFSVNTSNLTFDVKGGPNTADFKLEK